MRMNSYSRYPSVAAPVRFSAASFCIFWSCFLQRFFETKHERGNGPVLRVSPRYILAPFRRSRRGKVKARDPIQRWGYSFQVCCQLLLYLKNAGVATPGLNLCFTDQTFVSFAPHLFKTPSVLLAQHKTRGFSCRKT